MTATYEVWSPGLGIEYSEIVTAASLKDAAEKYADIDPDPKSDILYEHGHVVCVLPIAREMRKDGPAVFFIKARYKPIYRAKQLKPTDDRWPEDDLKQEWNKIVE